jgi:formylglycine-generating enzyme required for sulfatase activity
MIVVAGVGVLGGMHWRESAKAFSDAKAQSQTASARFKDAGDWEKPAHAVTLTKPFYLGKFEVTQAQYQQVMGTNPSGLKGRDRPVENVSWDDAQGFCKKASEKTGLVVRLPTEAEWEHACRDGTRTAFYTGDAETDLDRAAWYDKNSNRTTHPVGQKVPNAWGLYDMHGNVWEWCADWLGGYGAGAMTDPQGPAEGPSRVLRGGSWSCDPGGCRSAYRLWATPDARLDLIGFRVAADVPSKAP